MSIALSIVLPCYNPTEGWEQRVLENIKLIEKTIPALEVILVNDGSEKDISKEVALVSSSIQAFKYISYQPNKGKGQAIRTGLDAADGKYIIYTDIDFPYTYDSLVNIYKTLEQGYDIAAGIKNDAYYDKAPKLRTIMSKSLRWMSARLLKISINDTQCGLKGMNQNVKEIWLNGKIDRYLFDLEAVYKAERKNKKIKAVPIELREGVVFSKIKISMMLTEVKNFIKVLFSK